MSKYIYIYITLFRIRKKLKIFFFAKKWNWFFEIPFIYFLLITKIQNSWKFSTYGNFGHINPSVAALIFAQRNFRHHFIKYVRTFCLWSRAKIPTFFNFFLRLKWIAASNVKFQPEWNDVFFDKTADFFLTNLSF